MRKSIMPVSVTLWAAAVGGCVVDNTFRISATPKRAAYDEPVSIVIDRALPGKAVRLTATACDGANRTWRSEATFTADRTGRVNVSTAVPVSGSYKKADGMGLFWSMIPEGVKDPSGSFLRWPHDGPLVVTLRVETEGRPPLEATLERLGISDDVAARPVSDGGLLARPSAAAQYGVRPLQRPPGAACSRDFPEPGPLHALESPRGENVFGDDSVGMYFCPKDSRAQKRPAVLVLGGSEGGLPMGTAALLAGHGYATLALAYFGTKPLPDQLVEIPVDYVASGARWLREQPEVDAEHIGVIGSSKGGELALLVAAEYPELFRAVVGISPASVVFAGIYKDGRDYRKGLRSSWSRDGRPVPFADLSPGFGTILKMMTHQPEAIHDWYAQILKNAALVKKASIPVERIQGPILLLAGTDDRLWPSAEMTEMVMQRRRRHNAPWPDESYRYTGAGHAILPPYFPTCFTHFGDIWTGGTPEANAAAAEASYRTMLRFLAKHLGKV